MAVRVIDWEQRIGHRLRLKDLHILDAAVRWGTMARAAKQLGMSQPSVSEAIASLEETLRVPLLDRSPRGVEPTVYARALLERANIVFDELRQSVRDIAFLSDPTAGEVRVGCPESLAAGFVPAVIERMSRHHPGITVHVVAAQPGEQEFRELRERGVDVLLGRLFKPVIVDDVAVEVLADDAFVVVAGKHSAWARRRRIALADLIHEAWVMFPPASLSGSYIEAGFRARGLAPPARQLTSFSMQLRFHLLATGRFLTVLHQSVLQFNAARWTLIALTTDFAVRPMPLVIFSLKHRSLSPVVHVFMEHARQVAKSLRAGSAEWPGAERVAVSASARAPARRR